MTNVTFQFYDDLQRFLTQASDDTNIIEHSFDRKASVKDVVESLGIPHPEVQSIHVKGNEVGFSYILRDQDYIQVRPLTPPFDVFSETVLRPIPLEDLRFVVDVNVGKLASLLRMAGFDTIYRNDFKDESLARIASRERRILLTKDVNLLKRKIVVFGHFIRETEPKKQLREVFHLYKLFNLTKPFSRCILCNGLLESVEKAKILPQLEPLTKRYYDLFYQCPGCQKIYWAGSHRVRMENDFQDIFGGIK